jgi:hypothetical protein
VADNDRAELYRELDEKVKAMADDLFRIPSRFMDDKAAAKAKAVRLRRTPPLWAEEEAVAKLVFGILDIGEYRDAIEQAIQDDGPGIRYRRLTPKERERFEREDFKRAYEQAKSGDFRPLAKKFQDDRSNLNLLDAEARELIAVRLLGKFESPRDAGRPPLTPKERHEKEQVDARSMAEDLYCVIWGLLRALYSKQDVDGRQIRNRALTLTVKRFDWHTKEFIPDYRPDPPLTPESLKNFMGRSESDPKRYGKPKPKLRPITIAQYLNIR